MTKSEKIKLFGIDFFTKILWRKVAKDGEPIPAGPYMLVYVENKYGVFWLIFAAIPLKIYRFTVYWFNRWRKKPNFFDKILRDAMTVSYDNGYRQCLIDSKGTERRMKIFKDKIHNKTQSGIGIN